MPKPAADDPGSLSRRGFLAASLAALVASCSGDDAGEPTAADPTAAPAPTSAPTPDPTATPEPTPTPAVDELAAPAGVLSAAPFALGVASGDPTPESVILWTRLIGAADELAGPIEVLWEVADDDTFSQLRATGIAQAHPALAHSLHIDATGLEPDRWYSYRFRHGDHVSLAGRTRTLPAPDASAAALRFGFGSCQHYETSFYAAHRHLATEGLDLFVWLGDYIYEGGPTSGGVRSHDSNEVENLDGYRSRYELYKRDPDLQLHHATNPWLLTWDDHEVDNDYGADLSENDDDPDAFRGRRFAAYQAWYEHQPVRLPPPESADWDIHRSVGWGDLARLYLLDGRQHRDPSPTDGEIVELPGLSTAGLPLRTLSADALDPARSMLGADQQRWLVDTAAGSSERWNVLAQPVFFHGLNVLPGQDPPLVVTYTWDGYAGHRREVLDQLAGAGADNLVVLSGDFHAATVGDVRADPYDYSLPVVATEFMAPAIASGFPLPIGGLVAVILGANPQIKMFDDRRGYTVCDVSPERWVSTYRALVDARDRASDVETISVWEVLDGSPGATRQD